MDFMEFITRRVLVMNSQKLNILYDVLVKVQLVELVMKSEGMDLKDIQKVKEQLENKIKEPS